MGRVIYNGIMPEYGTILILDHGDREYSLYGRVVSPLATVGEVVQKGQVIAQVGEPDATGKNLYFEIRKNGKPLNPALFIKAI